jgi:hypothetical protein
MIVSPQSHVRISIPASNSGTPNSCRNTQACYAFMYAFIRYNFLFCTYNTRSKPIPITCKFVFFDTVLNRQANLVRYVQNNAKMKRFYAKEKMMSEVQYMFC